MKLIIVESPTKTHSVGDSLSSEYKVLASKGHVRDLDTSGPGGLGVDIKNGFKPTYKIQKDKMPIVKELREECKKADEVILGTDPDREGEAIAWHLAEVLGLDVATTPRIVFHEITPRAIREACKNPSHIDMNLVHSQECRRIMDRIVGFRLSSLLQKKIKSRSAGRVQSVVLGLIVDKEREIKAFVPENYWVFTGTFGKTNLKCPLLYYKGKTIKINSQEMADSIQKALPKMFSVTDITENVHDREPKPPFTTATLQRESFNVFHYSLKKTQLIAQHLYEGKDINGTHIGLITYIRTDADRVAPEFIAAARDMIEQKYGKQFFGRPHSTTKKSDTVQDAHEAIRPTDLNMTPEKAKDFLTNDEWNVYRLIYARAVASLMVPRKEKTVVLKLTGNDYTFKADSVSMVSPGYSKVYGEFETYAKPVALPDLKVGDQIELVHLDVEKKSTQPPARFNEGRVVEMMKDDGIGRPSTYATTIDTLEDRKYIDLVKKVIVPTDQGELTVDKLKEFFPELMDISYTANMETELDKVADGEVTELTTLQNFYKDFESRFSNAEAKMEKIPDRKAGRKCPECGADLVYRKGRYGEFVACSAFPKCHYVEKSAPEYVEGKVCPECGGRLVKKHSKTGREFIGCSNYPKCTYIEGNENRKSKGPVEIPADAPTCPKCHKGKLITKNGRFGPFIACSNYPACHYIVKTPKKAKKADDTKGEDTGSNE